MTFSSFRWSNQRINRKRALEVYELNGISMVNAKLKVLSKRLESMDVKVVFTSICDICKGGHNRYECQIGGQFSQESSSERLELGELKPTIVTLQLVDQSIKYPTGIKENIPIKVEKFYVPMDFFVLEMGEDVQVLPILGSPFLATNGAIIDVKNRKLTFDSGDKKVEFDIFQTSK
ncbi:uncharacterized protein LOC123228792 [Mangifera indica]|uniref:uncharacterized protein LOC123228792 n=1 Tax=Mangifera indica TaxID=29780 RepID=UPI001CFBA553|nr:uncharacterized protein LOC123228792 [Mangifera indica]